MQQTCCKMSRRHLSLLFLSLLVLVAADQVNCDTFYIITAPGNFCPEQYLSTIPDQGRNSCLTLSEFILNDNHQRQSLDPETVILKLESGNHTLNASLLVSSNITSFSILAANLSATTTIHCVDGSHLHISTVDSVQIKGINFVGCYTNKIESASTLSLKESNFYLATLSLINVSNASIVNSSYSSNSYVNTTLYVYNSVLFLKNTEFVNNRGNIVGALQIVDSDVAIERCLFLNNSVQNFRLLPNSYSNCGGAIFALTNSVDGTSRYKLTINSSSFSSNEATDSLYSNRHNGYDGGAICIQIYNSLVISNSSFENNRARHNGGAIFIIGAYKGTVHIDTSLFKRNGIDYNSLEDEAKGSGALYVDGGDVQVVIDQSEFSSNTGGVKIVAGVSIFNCTRSVFANNKGRGLYVSQRRRSWKTFISIDRSHFIDNFLRSTTSLPSVYDTPGGGAVTIQALQLFNGDSFTVWLSGSTFSNNYANYSGGAVKILLDTFNGDDSDIHVSVHVANTTFLNNICDFKGWNTATVYGLGGAMIVNVTATNSSVSVVQSAFIDNKSPFSRFYPTSKGGALALAARMIAINQTVFFHNEANLGGALYINRAHDVLITESTFLDNTISGFERNYIEFSGAALFVETATNSTTIKRSVFRNNTAPECGVMDFNHKKYRGTNYVSISESYFQNNRATKNEGGVICTNWGPVSIVNSTFSNNSASENGGVLFAYNGIFTIVGSTFDTNTAEMSGGALHGSGEYSISGSTFIDNKAESNGGAVMFSDGGRATINSSNFINNNAGSGGALYLTSFVSEFWDVWFYANMVEEDGEAITACTSVVALPDELNNLLYIYPDPQYKDNFCIFYDEQIRNHTQTNSSNNTTATYIPYVVSDYLLVKLSPDTDCGEQCPNITLQKLAESGMPRASLDLEIELVEGRHILNSSNLNIRYKRSVVITGNNATIECLHQIIVGVSINVHINNVTFIGCEIAVSSVTNFVLNNVKFRSQNGKNNIIRLDDIVSTIISHSSFTERNGCCNYWPSHHIIANNVRQLLVTHCTFLNNWGGCIYSEEVHLTVEHTNFTDNTNYPTNNPWGRGGAISVRHSSRGDSVNITNCMFTGNLAGYGGAVYVSGSDTPVWITQSVFTRNRAYLYFGGAVDVQTDGPMLIDKCEFQFNNAEYDGGAVYSESMALSINRSNFTQNTVKFRGGGAVRALNSLSVSYSQFTSNKAARKGGAIHFNTSSSATVSLNHSNFTYNMLACRRVAGTRGYYTSCGNDGTALYFKVGAMNSIVISDTYFVNNTAEDPSIEKQDVYIIGTDSITYIYNTTDADVTTSGTPATTIEMTDAKVSTTGSPTSEVTVTATSVAGSVTVHSSTPDVITTTRSSASSKATTTELSSQTETVSTTSETTVSELATMEERSSTTGPTSLVTNTLPAVSTASIPNRSTTRTSVVTVHSQTAPTVTPVNETISTSVEGPTTTPSFTSGSTTTSPGSTSINILTESTTHHETETEITFIYPSNTPVIYHTNAETITTGSTVATGVTDERRQQIIIRKIIIPVVVVIATILLLAALVFIVVFAFYCSRRGKRNHNILSNNSNSYVELMRSDSPENVRKFGDEEL